MLVAQRYYHDILGYNSRLDEIQAAILNIKLKYIDSNNIKRVNIAKTYNSLLKNISYINLPRTEDHSFHVYHQYTILSEARDTIKEELEKNNIKSAIYYPLSLEKQIVFKNKYSDSCSYKNSNLIANTCLSLPMFPNLTKDEVKKVCKVNKISNEKNKKIILVAGEESGDMYAKNITNIFQNIIILNFDMGSLIHDTKRDI